MYLQGPCTLEIDDDLSKTFVKESQEEILGRKKPDSIFSFSFSVTTFMTFFLCLKIAQIIFHVVYFVAHCDNTFMESEYIGDT